MKKALAILFAPLLLSACGSIDTSVSVLNPQVISNARNLSIMEADFHAALNQDEEYIYEKLRPELKEIDDITKQMGDALISLASTFSDGSEQKNTLTMVGNEWLKKTGGNSEFNKKVNVIITQIDKYNSDVRRLLANHNKREDILDGNITIPYEIKRKLTTRRLTIDKLEAVMEEHKKSLIAQNASARNSIQNAEFAGADKSKTSEVESSSFDADKRVEEAFSSIDKKLETDVQQLGLDSDVYAYYIANAGDSNWEKTYNQVEGFGLFGNSDFIIIVDGSGNLRMKGISFDPSKVAQMASKVTTQSIIVAASMMGASVPKGDPSQSNANQLAKSSEALKTQEEQSRQLAIKESEYRQSLLAIAHAVVDKEAQLKDKDNYNAATAAFKASFEAHKTRIKPND